MKYTVLIKVVSGPAAALLIYFLLTTQGNTDPLIAKMAAIAIWMAVWWLTEAVNLAVTALLPVILLPITGIAQTKVVAAEYMDPIIFLFIGGFMLAFALERWGLHKRLALRILMAAGSKPKSVLAGVMFTSWFISMWMSNTATVMVLYPAVIALIAQLDVHTANDHDKRKIATALLLGLAYSATIGGMATLVGTPTNMILVKFYHETFADLEALSFTQWFAIGFPVSVALIVTTYFILNYIFLRHLSEWDINLAFFKNEYKNLGPMRYEEKVVAIIFGITAFLWFSRSDIDFGSMVIPGWKNLLPFPDHITDSTVAIAMALLLFFIPAREDGAGTLLRWRDAEKVPLGIILLFGGGFAMAKGIELSGLDRWMADGLSFLHGVPVFILIIGVCILVTVISEFASNVASIQLCLPVLMVLNESLQLDPILLMLPATLAASLGFMLPVATAANTIVYGSERIYARDMLKAGLWLDVLGILIIAALMMSAGRLVFGV